MANLSAETDLSEDSEVRWQRTVDDRRRNCQAECEIKAGLGDAYTTDGRGIYVGGGSRHIAVASEHSEQHCET